MIITWRGVYHSGTNAGWDFNGAANFGTRDWLEAAKKYAPCACLGENTVIELDLDEIKARM